MTPVSECAVWGSLVAETYCGAEALLVSELPAVVAEFTEACVVLSLRLYFRGGEDETGVAWDVERVEIKIGGAIDEEWASVK
jgi:hypothetical protein